MTPRTSNNRDAASSEINFEMLVNHQPMGLSTLDLLARCPPEGWQDRSMPAKVKQEMIQLAKANRTEPHRSQKTLPPRVTDLNTLGLPRDPPPLGNQGGRQKQYFVHGTPVQRRLIAGKLVRTSDLDDRCLSASISAPELSRAIHRQVNDLKALTSAAQDTLGLVLSSDRVAKAEAPVSVPMKREPSPAELERIELRQQENQLQVRLLHVTQKMTRKYAQQLDHHRKAPATSKIHVLAEKWEQQGRQSPERELSAGTDNEQYKLYMASRFSTQAELDYYPRKIEPREPATDKHRRHTMHTKYGNALARNKRSLRGPF